jgi:hypothetical protein
MTTGMAAVRPRNRSLWSIAVLLSAFLLSKGVASAADGLAADAHTVPAVDAGIGPCSAEFTVRDAAGAAVYNAKVRVHIAYGFLRAHKLDLEVGTNVDGKARFDGLPDKVKEPLHFEAVQGELEGSATYNPAEGCKAQHSIDLRKPKSDSASP